MNKFSQKLFNFNSYRVYVIIFYFSAFMMLYITSFGIYWSWVDYKNTGKITVGEIIVKNDLFFKGTGKLVTYLAIFSVLSWFCVIKIGYNRVQNTPKIVKEVLSVVAITLVVTSAYEFTYNFIIWDSLITVNVLHNSLNFDEINTTYPNPETPWNLVFATKMTLAALIISCHSFYVVHKSSKKSSTVVIKNSEKTKSN